MMPLSPVLSPDCLTRLKLRQAPFEAVPSEDFLYSDPLLESLIETATRALATPGALVILAGVEGAGRSVQLMRLLGALTDDCELIAFRARRNIPFDAIAVTIRNHLRTTSRDYPNRSLGESLAERGKEGKPLILAVDDAHLLDGEVIRHLLRLRSETIEISRKGLRLILVGDSAFSRGHLPLLDPNDETQVVRLNLRPFNLEQAGAYLRHRLRVAGLEDPESLLTSGDIAALQTSSKGIPAVLNANANAWLARRCRGLEGWKQAVTGFLPDNLSNPPALELLGNNRSVRSSLQAEQKTPSSNIREQRLLAGKSQAQPPSQAQIGTRETAKLTTHEERNSGKDPRAENYDFEQVLRQIRNHQLPLEKESRPTPISPTPAQPAPLQPIIPQPLPFWRRWWFIPSLLSIVVLAIAIPVLFNLFEQPDLSSARSLLRSQTSKLTDDSPDPNPLESTQPNLPSIPINIIKKGVETTDLPEKTMQPTQPTAATSVPNYPQNFTEPTEITNNNINLEEDRAWLKRQAQNRYTIQLLAARSLQNAEEFVARNNLTGVHYLQTHAFVIVVFGSFPSRSEAKQALTNLPNAIRTSEPWIRTIGSVAETR